MDPILDSFQRAAEDIRYSEPMIAIISNVTGRTAEPGLMSCSEYWRGHIRKPVRFADSIRSLRESGQSVFLEIGPHPVLTGMARLVAETASGDTTVYGRERTPQEKASHRGHGGGIEVDRLSVPEFEGVWASSLHRDTGNWESLLESVSTLYLHGVNLEWSGLHARHQRKRIVLPTYPFQRERYWLEQREPGSPAMAFVS